MGSDDSGMAQNFIAVDREQAWLMPPSVQDWLPEDHYAWFVLASVEQMDLSAFLASYRLMVMVVRRMIRR